MLKSLVKLLVFATFVVVALIGLFVAWWIAVFAALGVVAYVLVRRFLGLPMVPRRGVVIDGEFKVERGSGSNAAGNGARPPVTIEQGRPGDAP